MTSLDQVDQSLKTVVDDRRLLSDTGFVKDNRSRHSDEMKPKISCSHKNLLRVWKIYNDETKFIDQI